VVTISYLTNKQTNVADGQPETVMSLLTLSGEADIMKIKNASR